MPTKTPACRVLPGILLVLFAVGRPAAAAEPQSWPMPEWSQAAPVEVGMDAALLEKARDYALTGEGSGYVTRHGKLVFSWGDPKRLYDLKSSTKSFGATALGLAIADGKMKLADKAVAYQPSLGNPPPENLRTGWIERVTVFHLATQTAGFDKPGGYTALLFEPGTKWAYSDGGPNWLAECITLVYKRDVAELMFERVFTPLGIRPEDLTWRRNQYRDAKIEGVMRREFGSGISANVDAMARFGLLHLREGRWQDRQILPRDFVAAVRATPPQVKGLRVVVPEGAKPGEYGQASNHYGLLWWNNNDGTLANVPRDAYWTWGLGDSMCVVIPSLDVVVTRAGKAWPVLPGGHYAKLAPFLDPIVASVGGQAASATGGAPYPPSPVIASLTWAPKESIIRRAPDSDNWPIAWADDGHLYTAYGDGQGFGPKTAPKLSMGLARVEGSPDAFTGVNVAAETLEQRGEGAKGRKASGILCLRGTLYLWVRNAGNSQLAWSADHRQTWTWASWRFTTSFGCPTFLAFGKDYAGARDAYAYVYSFDSDSAYDPADRMVLARVPAARIAEQAAYEYFVRLGAGGRPEWSADIARRGAVFEHKGRCYRSGISYNAGLKRYLWWQAIPGTDTRLKGGFGVYDAPQPWGPWTTVYFTERWDVGPGESACFPTKWMSSDGRTVHLVFSGDDAFSVRRATLELKAPAAAPGGNDAAAEPSNGLRLSAGFEAALPGVEGIPGDARKADAGRDTPPIPSAADTLALDLGMDDDRYLPVALTVATDQTVPLDVEVPADWRAQVEAFREDRSENRHQLVPLGPEAVALKAGRPQVLWLRVGSRAKPAGAHRLPLRVRAGKAEAALTVNLHIWPVPPAAARPFHVLGFADLVALTGGYEVNDASLRRLEAFYRAYAEMGGDVLDWLVSWPSILQRVRIAGTDRTLGQTPPPGAAPIDLDRLPPLDFSYFNPWLDVAKRHGLTRFQTFTEDLRGERWQWALDMAVGKGRVKAGTPEFERVAVWIYGELKRHVAARGFEGFFCKISDEILPEEIPSYLANARVVRQAGWRPFTTVGGMLTQTAEHIRQMNPLCDEWQLGFCSKDVFLHLTGDRYALAESATVLDTRWYHYTNGDAEGTWNAHNVFGPGSLTGVSGLDLEKVEVLEDGKPLATSGGGPWGNRKAGLAILGLATYGTLYVSPSDGRSPKEHRIELKLTYRRPDPAGRFLAQRDPTDEVWCYGGPDRCDRLPYHETWSYPAMALYHGFHGYAQWAFQWWKEDHRIVWLDAADDRVKVSPAWCGYRDGYRDAVLFHRLIATAGRAAYDRIIGPQAGAVLRVEEAGRLRTTILANAADFAAVNTARRRALEILAAPAPAAAGGEAESAARPRLLVLTDIGGDPDDQQAMVRLMTHANEFEIEGLIASASGTPGELKKEIVQPDLIREIVRAYGRVLPNLRLHAPGYPDVEQLLARIKAGNPKRGWERVGEGHDMEGSRWIIAAADRSDPRPLNITIWGGQTDLAQALWRVRADRGDGGYREFARRLRIYDIGDQDGIVERIWKEFPGLFYVLGQAPAGKDKRDAVYRGMYLGGNELLTSRQWIDANVRQEHGPLGALYPPKTWTAPNPHSALKEGDTPSWFFFLLNGLGDPAHPEWGGWGGRFQRGADGVYRDARDKVGDVHDARAMVWRWRPAFQNQFQARMDWCVKPRAEANHTPIAVLNGDTTRRVTEIAAAPGQTVRLSAAGSADPDGGALSYRWWVYAEAGTYGGVVSPAEPDRAETSVTVPANVAGKTIHIILEVTDGGNPPLTAYRRCILSVSP